MVTTYHDKQKKPSLVEALSVIDQSSNTGRSSNASSSSSKYFEGMETSLERPRLFRRHVSNQTTMVNSVHLDCSQASVGTVHGIAEGATVSYYIRN